MSEAHAKTVLIADDFEAFQRFLRSALQEVGFQTVVEVSDGLEAVEKAAELQPAFVLLDIQMPNWDGLKAATRIRSLAPKSRVLFISQNTDPDIVRYALRDGAAGYLCKSGKPGTGSRDSSSAKIRPFAAVLWHGSLSQLPVFSLS